MILIIKHIDIEGPETLGDYLFEKKIPFRIIDLSLGESLPETIADLDAVVCLGGPMNVYEEERYPFLKQEDVFIKKLICAEIPFLGICLGSQLLAKAAGAQVRRSPKKEIGFSTVTFTEKAKYDTLFQSFDRTLNVFQWHEDMFEVPDDATLLASSKDCPHQMFREKDCLYGVQFHIEITGKSIEEWSDRYCAGDEKFLSRQKPDMLNEYARIKESFQHSARIIYNNFLNIIQIKSTGRQKNANRDCTN